MQPFDRISIISQNDRSTVSLVCLSDSDTLAVLKERQGASFALLKKISQLKSPYFPVIYEIERSANTVSILEEQLCGKTLREVLDYGQSLSEDELVAIAESVAKALLTLHTATPPIIMRDLKPENIMITDDRRVMIVDLDAAREYDSETADRAQDTVLLGTRSYAAPEQYGFTQTDVRSDIYSFGIVIQEMLGNSHCNNAFTKKAQKILRKATMFAPEDRYQNINQMFSDIRHLRSALPEKILRIVLSAACALVVGITAAVAMITKQDSRTSAELPKDDTLLASNVVSDTPLPSVQITPTPTAVPSSTVAPESSSDASMYVTDSISVWTPDDTSSQTVPNGDTFYYKNAIFHRDEANQYCFWGFFDDYTPKIVTIPCSIYNVQITIIDRYALAGRETLTEVTILDGITSIREQAFEGCHNLKKITIPDSVTEFGDSVFADCINVTIYCHEGSAAEQYAKDHGISYIIIE